MTLHQPHRHVPALGATPWADHVLDLREQAPQALPETLTPLKQFTYAADPGWSATVHTHVATIATARGHRRKPRVRQTVLVISTGTTSAPGAPASRLGIAVSASISADRGKDTTAPGESDCPLAKALLLGQHASRLRARTPGGEAAPFFHTWLTAVQAAVISGTWSPPGADPDPAVGVPGPGTIARTRPAWVNRIGWARLGARDADHVRDLRTDRILRPSTLLAWFAAGFDVDEAPAWRRAGFADPHKAQGYRWADMDPDTAHRWHQRATFVAPSTAAVLSRAGWGPGTAERLHVDLTSIPSPGAPPNPHAANATALLEAAAGLTVAKADLKPGAALECAIAGLTVADLDGLSPAQALACARAGLTGPEIAALRAADRLDPDSLAVMAALRT